MRWLLWEIQYTRKYGILSTLSDVNTIRIWVWQGWLFLWWCWKCHKCVLFTHFNVIHASVITSHAFDIFIAELYVFVLNFNPFPYSFMFWIESHFNSLSSTWYIIRCCLLYTYPFLAYAYPSEMYTDCKMECISG